MPFWSQNGSEVAVIGTRGAKVIEMGDQNAGLFFVRFLEVCEQISTQGGRSLIRVSLGKESPGRSSQGELARALMSQGGSSWERILREEPRESQEGNETIGTRPSVPEGTVAYIYIYIYYIYITVQH